MLPYSHLIRAKVGAICIRAGSEKADLLPAWGKIRTFVEFWSVVTLQLRTSQARGDSKAIPAGVLIVAPWAAPSKVAAKL